MFPPGTRPGRLRRRTQLRGLVPFEMRDAGLGRRAVPYFGRSSRRTSGCIQSTTQVGMGCCFAPWRRRAAALVPLARACFGIPYTWSRHADATATASVIRYESARVGRAAVAQRGRVADRFGDPPTPLEKWLTARWGAHSPRARANHLGAERARSVAAARGELLDTAPTSWWLRVGVSARRAIAPAVVVAGSPCALRAAPSRRSRLSGVRSVVSYR